MELKSFFWLLSVDYMSLAENVFKYLYCMLFGGKCNSHQKIVLRLPPKDFTTFWQEQRLKLWSFLYFVAIAAKLMIDPSVQLCHAAVTAII